MARQESTKAAKKSASENSIVTRHLLAHAAELATECEAAAILVYVDALPDQQWDVPEQLKTKVFFVTKSEEEDAARRHGAHAIIRVPKVALTRLGQIKVAVLLALSRGLLSPGDRLVCVSGAAEAETLDTLVLMEVGREFEMLVAPDEQEEVAPHIMPEVLTRVIDVAAELGSEGREGRPVGAIFVVGDTDKVLPLTRPLVLNPFQGYKREERNLLDPHLEETVKEFSTIDGAFIIRGDGVVEAAGAYLKTSGFAEEGLPRGLGARHQAAAAISSVTDCVAVTVSQSTGTVSIFRGGRLVTELEKPRRIHARKRRREGEE